MNEHECDECGWIARDCSDPEEELMKHHYKEHSLSKGLHNRQEKAIEIFRNINESNSSDDD